MCQVNGPSYSVQCDQCGKSMRNTDDICPHCKHNFAALPAPQGSGEHKLVARPKISHQGGNVRRKEDTMDELTSRIAEEITAFWRSFDESTYRDEYKEKFRLAVHRAIIQELVVATNRELGPAKPTQQGDKE